MSVVYWIHLPEHTDMFSQGYIGVSQHSASFRFKQHLSKAKNGGKLKIHCAILKHKDITFSTVLEGSSEYCYIVERELRPVAETGWNLAVGGEVPHGLPHTQEFKDAQRDRRLGQKASAETKKTKSLQTTGVANPFFGKTHSDSAKKAISEKRKAIADTPWYHPMAKREMWNLSQEVYEIFSVTPNVTAYKIPSFLPITLNVASTILNKIKSGWIPKEDPKWLLFTAQGGLECQI